MFITSEFLDGVESLQARTLQIEAQNVDLKTLTKIQQEQTMATIVMNFLDKLLGNMNIDAQQLAQEKNIQYVLDWYEGQLSHSNFRGYPIYLSRILMIVVQNAVKFTPENGEIHVWMNEKCLDDSTSLLEFRCKDNGIGMSQDFIKHAFDLFAQEDSSSRSLSLIHI